MAIKDDMKQRMMARYRGERPPVDEEPTDLGSVDELGTGSVANCGSATCANNEDGKCAVSPEISAGGACMSRDVKTPMAAKPGEKAPMPEKGGLEE